jgi:hypothetical protein
VRCGAAVDWLICNDAGWLGCLLLSYVGCCVTLATAGPALLLERWWWSGVLLVCLSPAHAGYIHIMAWLQACEYVPIPRGDACFG